MLASILAGSPRAAFPAAAAGLWRPIRRAAGSIEPSPRIRGPGPAAGFAEEPDEFSLTSWTRLFRSDDELITYYRCGLGLFSSSTPWASSRGDGLLQSLQGVAAAIGQALMAVFVHLIILYLSRCSETSMARPVTLFTGQWADLPIEEMARMTADFGYDGIELACWGDHFEVDKAIAEDDYCDKKRKLLDDAGSAVPRHQRPPGRPSRAGQYRRAAPGDPARLRLGRRRPGRRQRAGRSKN